LDFLVGIGLVSYSASKYFITRKRIHLPSDSANIERHHLNWRLKFLQSLPDSSFKPIHYTGVIALSLKDAEELRSLILNTIAQSEKILANTAEEDAFSVVIDFSRL
jgi:hypothetical protein